MGFWDFLGKPQVQQPCQGVPSVNTALLSSMESTIRRQEAILSKQFAPDQEAIRGYDNGWNYLFIGKSLFFNQTLTFSGTTVTLNIDFPKAVTLNRLFMSFNDATAKDFDIRIYAIPGTYYVSINTKTGDINTSVVDLTDIKIGAFGRISIVFSNYTAGKITSIDVQADEL